MEREIDRRIGAASAVMRRSVYRTVVVKKELSRKAKLSIYRSIYVPTLTYGWLGSLRDRVRSSGHSGGARSRAAAPSHREESAEVAWASVSDAPWTPPREVFQACPTGRRPRGKTQDTLEKLCLSAGLGTPRESPRKSWRKCLGQSMDKQSVNNLTSASSKENSGRDEYIHFPENTKLKDDKVQLNYRLNNGLK
ncbi:hypothetical protein L3Q82_017295 [Scortum barcoo]|uniref:Uncharacterized protein n=1 Tax=Scortum barcoo TaxID=214431 RepID=A0ACB8VL64_9TELE|nr:hypothetical protein L3Q82_017295 [Scortum barcoo]